MQYEEFTGRVQERAALDGRQAAERLTRAVMETFGERVPDGVADHLAAQLPDEVSAALRSPTAAHEGSPEERAEGWTRGEQFDLPVFAARVAWREGVSEDEALRRTAAVVEVLDAAVAPELMRKLEAVLPPDIRDVLPSTRTTGGQ